MIIRMNLKELSATLGLSQTTVSRALNGYPEVSEETRARVRAAADLHDYRPSAAARRLATGQSGTLGIIFPAERNSLGDLIFTEFLGGCVERAADLGYDVTLAMARGTISEEAVYRRTVRNARVDAMVLSSPLVADSRPALLQSLGMPFIMHGRTETPRPYAFLDIDNRGAFGAATRLLVDLGHRAIALLNGECRYNYAADRKLGYLDALKQTGLAASEHLICEAQMRDETAYGQARALLAAEVPPTAFLCSSIAQAIGASRACREAGYRVGEDIALIAHDDRLHELRAETFHPPLTTTQSSIGDAGRRVVELAVGMLRNPGDPLPREVWPVDLVVRASTPARR
ncbi:MAG: substrate-binding domain-containing protein [Alphaproteobacteria bacterium]|nr:substrate-binding domain-containing protein [Alphaproteobacteria bacterium]